MIAFRPYMVMGAAFGALVLMVLLIGTDLVAASVVAVIIGVALFVVWLRGPGPVFDWVAPDHPDALGSLDTERITPPTP